jgi:hypothetical protein
MRLALGRRGGKGRTWATLSCPPMHTADRLPELIALALAVRVVDS